MSSAAFVCRRWVISSRVMNWKWLVGGVGAIWLVSKLRSDTEPVSPTRVVWKDVRGETQQRDFKKRSVAQDFVVALGKAGASAIQISAIG